jgi:hypothetical protein
VVFREFGSKSEPEEIFHTKNNPEKVQFELRSEEEDSNESVESEEEVEQPTSVVRRLERVRKPVERYSLPHLCSAFMLISTDDEPKLTGEAVE